MSGNYAKIRKVFPNISDYPEADDLERLAGKLDKAEEIEKFYKSEAGQSFRDHFRLEIAECIKDILKDSGDYQKLLPHVERLRVLTAFYKNFVTSSDDAETLRNMIDDYIGEIKV